LSRNQIPIDVPGKTGDKWWDPCGHGNVGIAGSPASALTGSTIGSMAWTLMIGGTTMVPAGNTPVARLLYLEFTYTGANNQIQEIDVDNVVLAAV
jgi:hypothetical protein